MKQAKKIKQALARRIKDWDDLPADGFIGASTKRVRHDNKSKAFIKPGSQNRHKGSSAHKKR